MRSMRAVSLRISGGIGPNRWPIRCWCCTSTSKLPTRTMLPDRKSTRLNSSHANISYAVFGLKKKRQEERQAVLLLLHLRHAALLRSRGRAAEGQARPGQGVAAGERVGLQGREGRDHRRDRPA